MLVALIITTWVVSAELHWQFIVHPALRRYPQLKLRHYVYHPYIVMVTISRFLEFHVRPKKPNSKE